MAYLMTEEYTPSAMMCKTKQPKMNLNLIKTLDLTTNKYNL